MKSKSDLVVHHNYLNESIFNFNELELNMFIVIIYKMRAEKESSVVFDAKEIKSLINSKDRSYKKFEKIIHGLQDRTIYLKSNEGYKRVKPFPTLDFNNKEKTVEVDINKHMIPFFKELKEQFTQYSLKEFLTLKSKHSKRLYQLLKQYEKIGSRTFDIEHLKELLECNTESYQRMYNFEKRVLETTKNDINEKTTITIDYTKIKSGREVSKIEFSIKNKKEKTTKNDIIGTKESRQDIIKRSLKTFNVSYIKDLTDIQKRMLDMSLKNSGYKPTTQRRGK